MEKKLKEGKKEGRTDDDCSKWEKKRKLKKETKKKKEQKKRKDEKRERRRNMK